MVILNRIKDNRVKNVCVCVSAYGCGCILLTQKQKEQWIFSNSANIFGSKPILKQTKSMHLKNPINIPTQNLTELIKNPD